MLGVGAVVVASGQQLFVERRGDVGIALQDMPGHVENLGQQVGPFQQLAGQPRPL